VIDDSVLRPPTPRQRRLAYFAWVTVCVVWGTTYLGIRVSLETMPPMLMGGLRWLIAGALVFAGVALVRWTEREAISDSGLKAQDSLAKP
jgi:drug/metabolite transporter (DMT)-like permease